tara:strand:- start:3669 stop:3899 length:231 start_codon:yes stop_codon:yes gene_type:complete
MAKTHQIDNPLYKALESKYQADINSAVATLIIYFDNPVAIGEHPQHILEMDKLVSELNNADEKLVTLKKYFNNTQI